MKTKKQTPKSAAEIPAIEPEEIAGATHRSAKSIEEITNEFIKKKADSHRNSDGVNCYIQDFAIVARFLAAGNKPEFTFNDVIALTRNLDTPASALISIFTDWLAELKKHKRLSTIHGCYDQVIYKFK